MRGFILISLVAIILIAGCAQTTPSDQTSQTNETESEIDYGSRFIIESIRNISLTDIQVSIRNIGSSNITLAKLTAYIDGESKPITDIVGMTSNVILGVGEVATFNVKEITNPCGKNLKLVLNTKIKFEDISVIHCIS